MKLAALGATILVVVVMASATTAAPQVRAPAIDFVNWSPNGRWLAFDYARDNAYQVRVVRPDGSAERKVLDSLRPLGFSWSPNSQRLAIIDGETTWVATSTGRLRGRIDGRFEDWAPDSQRLLVTRGGDTRTGVVGTIYMVGIKPRSERALAVGATPDWSPDGKLIAFSGGAYGRCLRKRIYVMAPSGRDLRQVSPLRDPGPYETDHVGPVWSPRGQYIGYGDTLLRSSPSPAGCPWLGWPQDYNAFTVPRAGGGIVPLGRGYPQWSPRGDLIALRRTWSGPRLEIITPRGKTIASVSASDWSFDWSPLGRRFAYASNSELNGYPTHTIHVAEANGADTPGSTLGQAPDWSPLGGRIAFVKENEWNGTCGDRIFLIRPDWTGERAVTRCAG